MDSLATRFVTFFSIGVIGLSTLACGGGPSLEGDEDTISRDKFIETYVELRKVGLQSRNARITLDQQREILDSLGTTEEELLAFVDRWGTDSQVMMDIWEDVDSIILEIRTTAGMELEVEEQARRLREEEDRMRPDSGDEGSGEGESRRAPIGDNRGEGEARP
ncbi:MAG: hypothetical protein PVJ76_17190 [Gemmatimonadota bacterium]|jgi:hypothetical protein